MKKSLILTSDFLVSQEILTLTIAIAKKNKKTIAWKAFDSQYCVPTQH